MKIKFVSQIFDYEPGNHGLTEEIMYNFQPDNLGEAVPIFSGSRHNEVPIGYINSKAKNNKGNDIKYFTGPCLILTKDGSAGLLTYKDENGIFTINHHACILKLKEEYKDKIDLEWFYYQYKNEFYHYVTSKSDNGVLSTDWFDKISFKIPDCEIQIQQKNKKKLVQQLINDLHLLKNSFQNIIKDTKINIPSNKHTIKELFNFKNGNTGLTAKFIYNNQPVNEDEKIPILSSATLKTNLMGFVSEYAKPKGNNLKIFEGPCILVARNGYAGTMTFIESGKFTINDHAYVIVPKVRWRDKINLRWFVYQYQDLFYNLITSKSDNATFSKKYANKNEVIIPNREIQDQIAEKLFKIDDIMNILDKNISEMEKILYYKLSLGPSIF